MSFDWNVIMRLSGQPIKPCKSPISERGSSVEGPVSVLVVDDSHCVRTNFQCLLEGMGVRMFGAATCGQALRILEREKPDIVVTDLHMPKIKGIDLLDRVQSRLPYATVIVLCGKNSQVKVSEVIRRGAWDCLEKPIQGDALTEAMNGALEQVKLVSGGTSPKERQAGVSTRIAQRKTAEETAGEAQEVHGYSPASYNDLENAYDITIEGWSRALELHDRGGAGHGRRVADLTLGVARAMDIDQELLVHMRRGALLHDIGNLGVPDRILLKPGKLDDAEYAAVKTHVKMGYDLLSPIEFLRPALDIPYCHHEKWDGTGYPRGLKGKEIPLCARIFAVADVWDALLSDRPQRPAWTRELVREEMASRSGRHFDPEIVRILAEHLPAGSIAFPEDG